MHVTHWKIKSIPNRFKDTTVQGKMTNLQMAYNQLNRCLDQCYPNRQKSPKSVRNLFFLFWLHYSAVSWHQGQYYYEETTLTKSYLFVCFPLAGECKQKQLSTLVIISSHGSVRQINSVTGSSGQGTRERTAAGFC